MSTGTNKERITQNNGIINDNNADLTALKTRINNLPTSGDTTATAEDILLGKTAVSKGVKITGTYEGTKVVLPNGIKFQYSTATNMDWLGDVDTSNITNASTLFLGNKMLTIPLIDTSNVTTMSYMFEGCTNLTTIPLLDTSNVTTMQNMFEGCTSLTEIPLLDTSNVTNMPAMFFGCTNLQTIPLMNTGNVKNLNQFVQGCRNLSNESLNNILAMCTNSAVTSNKTLKNISLSQTQATTCQTLSNWDAFVEARLEFRILKVA